MDRTDTTARVREVEKNGSSRGAAKRTSGPVSLSRLGETGLRAGRRSGWGFRGPGGAHLHPDEEEEPHE
jgi:hypothetical protein